MGSLTKQKYADDLHNFMYKDQDPGNPDFSSVRPNCDSHLKTTADSFLHRILYETALAHSFSRLRGPLEAPSARRYLVLDVWFLSL